MGFPFGKSLAEKLQEAHNLGQQDAAEGRQSRATPILSSLLGESEEDDAYQQGYENTEKQKQE